MGLQAQTLAAMLSDADCLNEGMTALNADWFDGKYKLIFCKLKEMYDAGEKVDVVTAATECRPFAGGIEWLLVENHAWDTGTVQYAAKRLRRDFTAKKLRQLATDIEAAINDEAQAHARQTETVVNPLLSMEDEDMTLPDFAMDSNEEVTTKLDLAKAYEDMGDLEGARELLQEVLKEGSPAQREKAQGLLAKLVS